MNEQSIDSSVVTSIEAGPTVKDYVVCIFAILIFSVMSYFLIEGLFHAESVWLTDPFQSESWCSFFCIFKRFAKLALVYFSVALILSFAMGIFLKNKSTRFKLYLIFTCLMGYVAVMFFDHYAQDVSRFVQSLVVGAIFTVFTSFGLYIVSKIQKKFPGAINILSFISIGMLLGGLLWDLFVVEPAYQEYIEYSISISRSA